MLARKITILGAILTSGVILVLTPASSHADEAEENKGAGEFHYFRVTDPIGFVTAIDTHYASECAANWQRTSGANVLLAAVSGDEATHMIYVGYPNYRKMAEGRVLFRSCAETSAMIETISKTTNTDSYSNVIFEPVMSFNEDSIRKYYVKTDVKIAAAKEADYTKAFVEFLADYTTEDGVIRDSGASFLNTSHHGINRVLFGNRDASHYVYFGGADLDILVLNMKAMLSSEAYNSFNQRVEAMRIVKNSALMEGLKFYPVERESK